MRQVPRFGRFMLAIVLTMVLILSLGTGFSSAQQSGIGVDNDGPSFLDISIIESDSFTFVNVEVKDLNGWNNIFSVNVTILDNQDRAIASVSYMQYSNLTSTVATILWNQTTGTYLDPTQSSWSFIAVEPWLVPDYAVVDVGLRVSFAFQKFAGQTINILAMDKGQLSCEYTGPFSAEYTPAPEWENVAIPISLSTLMAGSVAAFMVYRRFKSNKLARAVEASHAASGED